MHFIKELTDLVFLEDTPEISDILFIPGNGYSCVARAAAALYKKGLAPLLLPSGRYSKVTGAFTGPLDMPTEQIYETEWDFFYDILRKEGVPDSAILQENQATYTYENAIYSRKVTDSCQLNITKAIICCQAFHARRCRLYYEILYPDTQFFIYPVVTQDITKDNWYRDPQKTDIVLGEIQRWGGQFHHICREFGPKYKTTGGTI